jgi:hypothetical protein
MMITTNIIQPTSVGGYSILPLRRNWHVTFSLLNRMWEVQQEYRADIFARTLSKVEAIGIGTTQAREGAETLIVHTMDGRIAYQHNYDRYRWPD